MKNVFTNILTFSVLYFAIALLDLSAVYLADLKFLNYLAKPLLIVLLIGFYASNDDKSSSSKFVFLIIALGFFLLAVVATLFNDSMVLTAALVFFILGKLFYIFRFSNQRVFKPIRFLAFIAFYLLYLFVILYLTLDQLGSYLIPVSLFLFVSLMVVQFAFLRKNEVSDSSYQLVIIGVFLMFIGDTIAISRAFYFNWIYMKELIFILYIISQYLIVMGLVKEKVDSTRVNYTKTEEFKV